MKRVQLNCPWVLVNGGYEMYPVVVYNIGSYTYLSDDPNDASRLICECDVLDVVATAMATNPLVSVLSEVVLDG